jgi:hypothetical protein
MASAADGRPKNVTTFRETLAEHDSTTRPTLAPAGARKVRSYGRLVRTKPTPRTSRQTVSATAPMYAR